MRLSLKKLANHPFVQKWTEKVIAMPVVNDSKLLFRPCAEDTASCLLCQPHLSRRYSSPAGRQGRFLAHLSGAIAGVNNGKHAHLTYAPRRSWQNDSGYGCTHDAGKGWIHRNRLLRSE